MVRQLFHVFPRIPVDSLSNKKQMGDFCCGLLPNGANSHYSVCKLCLFSPSFTSTLCTSLPSDVFNTHFQCRYVILICFVLLVTGYLSCFSPNGKQISDSSALSECPLQPVTSLCRLWLLCEKTTTFFLTRNLEAEDFTFHASEWVLVSAFVLFL